MKLELEFKFDGCGNYGFKTVFNGIFDKLCQFYPEIEITKKDVGVIYQNCIGNGAPCGVSMLKIINPLNKKTTVLSFWDRTLEVTYKDIGWGDFNVVHVIGGLGVHITKDEWLKKYNIIFDPFSYPLDKLSGYEIINKIRKPYIYEEKVKKIGFYGLLYEPRKTLANILNEHPLFEILGPESGYYGQSYYEKMNECAIIISLNGNGELCLRDIEAMGLGIPILRSELLTQFDNKLIKNEHYICGSEPSKYANQIYYDIPLNSIANQFIKTGENVINNKKLLTDMSKITVKYFNDNILPEKIIQNFFKLFKLDLLK